MIGRNPFAASDCCRYDRCEFAIGGGLPGNEASASMLPLQRSMVRKRPARANTRSHRIELMPAHRHRISGSSFASPTNAPHRVAAGVAVVVAAFVISALVNRFVARRAERNNPPTGKFVEVGALRLHYTEQGQGPPLVLLHGNSGMIQDFTSSGLIDKAVKRYRVIVFDRPGFGHSNRPRRTIWTPEAQADFLHEALERIGVSRATVLGHSWGASVAVTMALKYPAFVGALVLASGYFYPTFRSDVVFLSGPSFPGIGDIMSHTVFSLFRENDGTSFLAEGIWTGTCAQKVRRVCEGNGSSAITDSRQRRGNCSDGPRMRLLCVSVTPPEGAGHHHCRQARWFDRHR